MNYRAIIPAVLILLIFRQSTAQSNSEMRSFIKTVPVGIETSFEVTNKYGNIHITPWSKDSAYIRAEVKAYASNETKLKKMFDGITVDITETKYLIRAQTEFTQNINMLFESIKGMTSNLISFDSRVEINYYINIPEYIKIKIENKYGDVYMEDHTGNLSLSISNGSFKANSLGTGSSITLAFCDATINSVTSGNIDASFSEISIGETSDISINSTSSRYDIKDAGIIRLESRRDKYFITHIEKLMGTSYFTDYKVNNLKNELNLTTRYGNINVDLIENGFKAIDINSGYTDISLKFDPGSSYGFDIRHVNAFLVLPEKITKSEKKALNEEKKEYITSGTVGKSSASVKVKIEATRANIYLK